MNILQIAKFTFKSSFGFPGQLKNWLHVQRVSPKLYYFRQQVLLCSARSQPQDCRSLLNPLLLDATGLPAAFPSTCQGMHPSDTLEKSTLRRMSLIRYPSCYRVSPKISILGLFDTIGLDAAEELVAIK